MIQVQRPCEHNKMKDSLLHEPPCPPCSRFGELDEAAAGTSEEIMAIGVWIKKPRSLLVSYLVALCSVLSTVVHNVAKCNSKRL